jgi:hypothetical protein
MKDQVYFQRAGKLPQPKRRFSRLAIASLILSIAAIAVLYLSFRRIETLHQRTLYVCIVITEKPLYTVLHNLCAIAPAVSVLFGILALLRTARSRMRLRGMYFALSGILVSATALAIYWLNLARLAEHIH